MWEQISEIFRRAAIRTADNVANFLPGLVVLLVILLGAFLVALSVRMILLRILRGVEFDRRAQQMGLAVLSDWSPTAGPSVLVGRTAMWVILVLGLLVGISALDATMPAQFALSVFQYVPNVLAALAILIGGHLISRFLARSVLIAAVNLQMQSARLLSTGVKWLVLVLAWAMALEHLGIGGRHPDARVRHPLWRHRAGPCDRGGARIEGDGHPIAGAPARRTRRAAGQADARVNPGRSPGRRCSAAGGSTLGIRLRSSAAHVGTFGLIYATSALGTRLLSHGEPLSHTTGSGRNLKESARLRVPRARSDALRIR